MTSRTWSAQPAALCWRLASTARKRAGMATRVGTRSATARTTASDSSHGCAARRAGAASAVRRLGAGRVGRRLAARRRLASSVDRGRGEDRQPGPGHQRRAEVVAADVGVDVRGGEEAGDQPRPSRSGARSAGRRIAVTTKRDRDERREDPELGDRPRRRARRTCVAARRTGRTGCPGTARRGRCTGSRPRCSGVP